MDIKNINQLFLKNFKLSIICCTILLYLIGYTIAILTWSTPKVLTKPALYFNFHFEIISIIILIISLKQFSEMVPKEKTVMLHMAKKYVFDPTLRSMQNTKKIIFIYLILFLITLLGYYLAKFESGFLISYFHLALICISLFLGSIGIIGWVSLILNIKKYENNVDKEFVERYGVDLVIANKMGLSSLEKPIVRLLLLISIETLCVLFLITYQLNVDYPEWFIDIRPIILFLEAIIFTLIFIFIPLYYAHSFMKKIKNLALENINNRSRVVTQKILKHEKISSEEHIEYQSLSQLKKEIENLSVWPIELPNWLVWFVSTVIINIILGYFMTKYSVYISQMP